MSAQAAPLDGRRLFIRADASPSFGTGHLMRQLALCEAWLAAEGRVGLVVAAAPGSLVDRFRRIGAEIWQPPGLEPGSIDDGRLLRALMAAEPDALAAIDGPAFATDYLERLGDLCGRLILIDDAGARSRYPVALVLNQNAHASREMYPPDTPSTRYLLGLRYVLIRREFVDDRPTRPPVHRVRRLLVTFGGADPAGMTARVITAIRRLPRAVRSMLTVRVVLGAANPVDEAHLEALAGGLELDLRRAVGDMASLMAWADLAIMSGGSTVWESACMGLPALVIATTPLESWLVTGLRAVDLFDPLEPADALTDAGLTAAIASRLDDAEWLAGMSARGMLLVDGQGARRVVEAAACLGASGARVTSAGRLIRGHGGDGD